MTNPDQPNKQGGLPADTGDNLSERSGYYDESESGNTGNDLVHDQDVYSPSGTPENVGDSDGSGTTFDGGSAIPR